MTTFAQFSNNDAYLIGRDALTAQYENLTLYNNGTGGGLFYYDSAGLNIGYGFNISGNTSTALAALQAAGMSITPDQWNDILAAAGSPAATSGYATALNNQLGNIAITQDQALQLLNSTYTTIESALDATLLERGLVVDGSFANSYFRAALADVAYNTYRGSTPIKALGPRLAGYISVGDLGGAAFEVAFNTHAADDDTAGTANRRQAEALLMLGFDPSAVKQNTTTLNLMSPTSVDVDQVIKYEKHIADAADSPIQNIQKGVENYLIGQAYYILQAGESISTVVTAYNALNTSMSIGLATLNRINTAFSDFNPGAGGVVHVPVGEVDGIGFVPFDSTKAEAQTYVYDPVDDRTYLVGSTIIAATNIGSNTANNDRNSLVIEEPVSQKFVWVDLSGSSTPVITNSGGMVSVAVGAGTLEIDTNSGVLKVLVSDGREIDIPSTVENVTVSGNPGDGYDIYEKYSRTGGTFFQYVPPEGSGSAVAPKAGDGGSTSLGNFINGLKSSFSHALTDPIVLDLSGTNAGVQLTSNAESNAYFDLHGTGFAVHTGWVGPTTGILVNSASPTSINDLFGNSSTDGFTALQGLDSNADGKIDASDAGFSSLYVWEDTNGNGTADAGEVHSLSSLGITSINLNATPTNELVNGNIIGSVASFTYSSGTTGQVAEAFLDNTQIDSQYTGSYTLNPAVLTLPNVRGYGTIPDLYIAMSQDSTLLSMVQSFATMNIADLGSAMDAAYNIVYQWTGVEAASIRGRGSLINGKDLDALEKIVGETFEGIGGSTNPFNVHQSLTLEQALGTFVTAMSERLLLQGPLATLLGGLSYDYNTDAVVGTVDMGYLIHGLAANAPSDATSATKYWLNLAPVVGKIASDLGIDQSTYGAALEAAISDSGSPLTLDAALQGHRAFSTYDSSGNAIFSWLNDTSVFFASTDLTGAIIEGNSAAANNTIDVYNTDLSQDYITDIQTLNVLESVKLTADQLSSFTNVIENSELGPKATINASSAGTYTLGSGVSGNFDLSAAGTTADITLVGNNQDGQILTAGSGNDTLVAGNGAGDILTARTGLQSLIGGNGGDTFSIAGVLASGSSIAGGTGTNVLVSNSGDISGAVVSGVQTLDIVDTVTVASGQLDGFTTITTAGTPAGDSTPIIYATNAGSYSVAGRIGLAVDLSAENTTDDITLIGNDINLQRLDATGSTGNVTLQAGNGTGDILTAGNGTDTLIGGAGDDTFNLSSNVSGDVINGGAGDNTLSVGYDVDLSTATITNIQTLLAGDTVALTATQLAGINTLSVGPLNVIFPTPGVVLATTAGVYSLSGKTILGNNIDLSAEGTTADITLIGSDADGETLTALDSTGSVTLVAGNGTGDTLVAGNGVDTITGGSGNDTIKVFGDMGVGSVINGGAGNNTLEIINNADISGVDISNVQNLQLDYGDLGAPTLTLTVDQLQSFSNITLADNSKFAIVTSNTADASSLDSYGATIVSLKATGTSGAVSLSGDDTSNQIIDASMTTGTATLTAGNGDFDVLTSGTGSVTITSGTGFATTLDASRSTGTAHLNAGSGSGASLIGGSGTNIMTSGDGDYDSLDGSLGTGNSTLTAGNGLQDSLVAGSGNDTLIAGTGGDYLSDGSGVDTLIGNSGDDIFTITYGTAGTTVTGGGGNDTLSTDSLNISGVSITGVQTLDANGDVILTAAQLNGFTSVINDAYETNTIHAVTAGTYSLFGKTSQAFNMTADVTGVTLTASAVGGSTLITNAQHDTINAHDMGGDIITGAGYETVNIGGNGASGTVDNVYLSNSSINIDDNSYVEVGGGYNTIVTGQNDVLVVESGGNNNITIGNGTTVYINNGTGDVITALGSELIFTRDTTLTNINGSNIIVQAYDGTTLNMSGNGKTGMANQIHMANGTINVANNANVQSYGANNHIVGTSNDTITLGLGNNDVVSAGSGSIINVWAGTGHTITASNDTISAVGSGLGFSVVGAGDAITAQNGSSVAISGNTTSTASDAVALSSGTITVANGARSDITGSTDNITVGNNALVGINGGNSAINLGSGDSIFMVSGSTNTVNGSGNEQYHIVSTYSKNTFNNGSGSTANGSMIFGVNDEHLWFLKSGNDLLVDVVGNTGGQETIKNWYAGNAGAQLSSFTDSSGLKLDSQINQLVNAMATYSAAHSSFNPLTATTMPTDSTLQSAITAAWHR